MSNWFGTSDEPLYVNFSHAKAANLLYAVIPRSTTKAVEVVSGAVVTMSGGAYDAEGYWSSGITTRGQCEYTIVSGPMSSGYEHTVITAWVRDMGQGTPSATCHGGMRISTGSAFSYCSLTTDGLTGWSRVMDNSTASGPANNITMTGRTYFAFCHANFPTNTSQYGHIRFGTTNQNATNTALTFTTGTTDRFDRVGCRTASRYRWAYTMVWNVALGDTEMDAIMDDPTLAVFTQFPAGGITSVQVDRGRTLGRGLGRGVS